MYKIISKNQTKQRYLHDKRSKEFMAHLKIQPTDPNEISNVYQKMMTGLKNSGVLKEVESTKFPFEELLIEIVGQENFDKTLLKSSLWFAFSNHNIFIQKLAAKIVPIFKDTGTLKKNINNILKIFKQYFEEPSFLMKDLNLMGASTPKGGDIVLYRDRIGDITHFAKVVGVNHGTGEVMVESKWGREPKAFRHKICDVPFQYGEPLIFVREKN